MVTKFTRHEFVKALILADPTSKIRNNDLTTLAKRGKLAINSARCEECKGKKKPCGNCKALEFIDLDYRNSDGHYINLDFLKKFTEGLEPVKKQRALKPKELPIKKKGSISVPVVLDNEENEDDFDEEDVGEVTANSSEAALTRAKKFAEIQNKRADTILKDLKAAQMKGELIPVDLVQEVIQIFAETVKRAYSDAGENLIMLISERLQAQDHDKAFMRTKLLDSTNKAIDDSVSEAQSKLKEGEKDENDSV